MRDRQVWGNKRDNNRVLRPFCDHEDHPVMRSTGTTPVTGASESFAEGGSRCVIWL